MVTRLDEQTDAELIGAAQADDPAAFGALVNRHQRSAVRIAAVALGSADGADDVAQDAFVKAHRALGRFRTGSPFEPWLYRIVTNTARNRLRRDPTSLRKPLLGLTSGWTPEGSWLLAWTNDLLGPTTLRSP